nr:hypothetical protein Itr_chr04CG04080 [Ipomoea trifida]
MAPLSSESGNLFKKPINPFCLYARFQSKKTKSGARIPATARRITAFFTATIKKAPTTRVIRSSSKTTHIASLDTLNRSFASSLKLVTAEP